MVSVEINQDYLNSLLSKKMDAKQVADILIELGMELEDSSEGLYKIDITAERTDMVSAEGIARAINSYTGGKPKKYEAKKSDYKVIIDKSVSKVRPFTACAIVKNLKLDGDKIKEVIWVQEKLHLTFCRNRKKAAIGIYPLEKIKLPIHYKALKPEDIKFIPLDFSRPMTGRQILRDHPTGREFGQLLEGQDTYPIFVDSAGQVMSMPPIINSETVGKVSDKTKDVFIECSGFDFKIVSEHLNIIVAMFIDMDGQAYEMALEYPDKKRITPSLEMAQRKIKPDYINQLLGTALKPEEISAALERMGYSVDSKSKDNISFNVPSYRTDIWHDVDIVDDIARGYGFNNIKPELPSVSTVGNVLFKNRMKKKISDIMVAFGFSEVFTLSLTDKQSQYSNMNVKEQEHMNLGYSAEKSLNMIRTQLLPEVIKCLVENRNREYPQKVFEIEHVVIPDKKEDVRCKTLMMMAGAISDSTSDITMIHQPIEALLDMLGINYTVSEKEHSSFVAGRCVAIRIKDRELCHLGELHPKVLENFGIVMPTAAFELDFEMLLDTLKKGR